MKMFSMYNTKTRGKFTHFIFILLFCLLTFHFPLPTIGQKTTQFSSSEILHSLKKLNVLGSVLYVAAHPDDENTRLLAYMAKDRQLRTGYLAMTRGDGGQNLIGDEQGIELGLIRTQELLAARRIDGAEQFFSRAYDFGFSKSTEEALSFWDNEKVLADAVWVIRKFRPDIIITRFPEDARAGHGHHSASAVIAREAFVAAADPNRFSEQFKYGVEPWQAKRILWNTFSFGSSNTTSENQMKIDVGTYVSLIGKSIGEISAESRSQHKSQGFGSGSSRGPATEYFVHILGNQTTKDPMDGIESGWGRVANSDKIQSIINQIITEFNMQDPSQSIPMLISLRKQIAGLQEKYWRNIKLKEVDRLIQLMSGLFMEASTSQDYAVQGDTLRFSVSINNRSGFDMMLKSIVVDKIQISPNQVLKKNQNWTQLVSMPISSNMPISQPYWLTNEMNKGSFNVNDQQLIGTAENQPTFIVNAEIQVADQHINFDFPLQHKIVDPAKGEIFQPLYIIPPVNISSTPTILVLNKNLNKSFDYQTTLFANSNLQAASAKLQFDKFATKLTDSLSLQANASTIFPSKLNTAQIGNSVEKIPVSVELLENGIKKNYNQRKRTIHYDHIPVLNYFTANEIKLMPVDLKTTGSKIGYVLGAGDKVPSALEQMGYKVVFLGENDLIMGNLNQFDAIVMGIRAYNVHDWLEQKYEVLMDYVRNGGNMIVQYNTSSNSAYFRNKIGPKPFTISRNRVTEEDADVNFIDQNEPLLNFPNKITKVDFTGWIQERGIYFGDVFGSDYRAVLSMHDKAEANMNGSLLVRNEGKGRFIYTGLVFFRELPAGIPGAFRLFANIVSNPNLKINESK